MAHDRLIVFARYPQPGQAKTRLIPALGPQRAAQLQEALTRHTLTGAKACCAAHSVALEVRFSGGTEALLAELLGPEYTFVPQQGETLGERLHQAIDAAFQAGAARVVVIGTDCPDLDGTRLAAAFAALERADLVLGPALDGGYYLVGLRRPCAALFEGIDWGTESVLEQTCAKARAEQLRPHLLPPLADVDYAEDLIACRRHASAFTANFPPPQPDLISIVIPTLNEAGSLSSTLDPLRNLPNLELVVADGGSTDGTPELARQLGAMVVPAQRGRGVQLNAGAALARGATLLFLHADSQLPERFQETVHTLLRTPCVAGAFRLAINAPGWPLRWVERGANTRARWLQLPYGDQGLFLAAERFFSVGGFPPWPILEDYELCRRLRRTGAIRLADEVVRTSARRWQKLGVVRTTLINQATLLGFHLGVPPQRLARWYTGFMPRS